MDSGLDVAIVKDDLWVFGRFPLTAADLYVTESSRENYANTSEACFLYNAA